MDNIFNNYKRQELRNKEMIIVLNRDDMSLRKWRRRARKYKNVRVYKISEKYTLGKCLNYGIGKAKYDILAKFDDDDYYGPHFLKEALRALKLKRVSIVGKHTSFTYFESKKALMLYRRGGERKYNVKLKGGSIVFRRSVWDQVKFKENKVRGCDARFLSNCKKAGYRTYSMSKYNYVCIRRKDTSTHTQKTKTKKYMARCKMICRTRKYTRIVNRK